MESESSEGTISESLELQPLSEEYLRNLSDDELIELWRRRWKGSQTQFAREYSLDQGNFSSWLRKKKQAPCMARAVFSFLSGKDPDYYSYFPSSLPDRIAAVPDPRDPKIIEAFLVRSLTLKQLLHRFERISLMDTQRTLKGIIFLDADQYISPILEFSEYPHLETYYHFVICISQKSFPRRLVKYLDKEWVSLLVSDFTAKDAADGDFIYAAASLNQKLEGWTVPFFFVTEDHFAQGLKSRMDELGYRKCSIVLPYQFRENLKDFTQST
jgi:hypothetical protein